MTISDPDAALPGSSALTTEISINRLLLPAILIGWFIGTSASLAWAQDDKDKNCTECHDSMTERFSGEVFHEPFKENDCYACHRFHGFESRVELKAGMFELCIRCHDGLIDIPVEEAHAPLTDDRSCVICHSPHRSDHPKLLLKPVKELCVDCHDSPADAQGTVHPPYAEFRCIKCHDPHGSFFAANLKLPPGLVCIGCHAELLPGYGPLEMHTGDGLRSCENCHSGHSGQGAAILIRAGDALCTHCHTGMKDVADREWTHDAVADGACIDCHTPHFLKGQTSLSSAQTELCGGCHDLADDDFLTAHLGLSPTACTDCHDPHGGAVAGFFRPFQHEPFAERECDTCHEQGQPREALRTPDLCSDCHDIDPVGAHEPETVAGKVCVDCHSPHGGPTEFFLR